MQLLMENWRRYLTEEEVRTQITTYLEENNIVLTEAELEEAMPRWMQKVGAGAALEGADPFEEMDILNDYGLVDQSSSGGKTTLSFKLATGGGEIVTIQVPTSQVPAQLR